MLNRIVIPVAALSACIVPVEACSLGAGTFLQSNFEMIDASDAIVIGEAVRKTKGEFGDKIFFEVTAILKGNPDRTVIDQSGRFGKPIPSDPNDISSANPEAYMGLCVRGTYRRGDSYVLMLHENEQSIYEVSGDPFSRMNEDDFGPDSLWRKTIESYLAIQKNPDRVAQLDEMRNLVLRGMSKGATTLEKKIGEDAMRHLLTIHPDKPTQWLMGVYADQDFAYRGLEDIIAGTEEEEADDLMSLVYEGSQAEGVRSVVMRALLEGDHPDAEPLFRDVIAQTPPNPTELGTALAYFIKLGEYDIVKRAFGEHILWIEGVTGPGAGPGFWSVVNRTIGYSDRRTVPTEFGDWWDRQHLASCLLENVPTDCNFGWDEAAALLAAPYANQKLLLAGASSPKVTAWAEAELDRLALENVPSFHAQWDFPMTVLLAAYRGDEPKRVHELACGTKNMREGLADLIGNVPTLYTEGLLREMMAIEQHEHVREQLFESAVLIAAHDMKSSRLYDADLAYAYARAENTLPLRDRDEKHLPCY